MRADADDLYDSASVEHSRRWELHMPSWSETLDYADAVREQALASLDRPLSVEDVYFLLLSLFLKQECLYFFSFPFSFRIYSTISSSRYFFLSCGFFFFCCLIIII